MSSARSVPRLGGGVATSLSLELIMRALASADRREILRLLREAAHEGPGFMSISDVALSAGIARFAASRHLAILCEAGLVERVDRRPRAEHRIRPEPFELVDFWLLDFL